MPEPLYVTIKNYLLEQIRDGTIRPGQALMSERDLCIRFGTSRMTVRQAISEMEAEGYVYRIQGKGTFASQAKIEQPLISVTGFSEDMRKRGMKPGSILLGLSVKCAEADIAAKMGIPIASEVIRLERLRLADGRPMAIERSHLNYALCEPMLRAEMDDFSLYSFIRNTLSLRITAGRQYMEAALMDEAQAALLKVPAGSLALKIERRTYTAGNTVLEVVESVYRGDVYRFYIELGGDGRGGAHGD